MSRATGAAKTADTPERVTRKATRKELRQAKHVRKQEKARKDNKEKNRERVRKGQKVKADPGTEHKPSIWEKMAEDSLYHQLREMGDTTQKIDKFQRKRVMQTLGIVLLGCLAGMFMHVWLYLSGPILGAVFYKMKSKRVESYYKAWKFQRQLNFSKFTRLVIPYLKASGGTAALYTIFNKILQRTEDPSDRRSLYQLMGEMGDDPESLQPFTDFAERSSGTDMSHLFMSTIYDFQQSTFDVSVIDELGHMASEDMMSAIDEIIDMKLRRFVMFPTKVVMSSFILVAGLGIGLMLDNFKDLDFNGVIADPTEQAEGAQDLTNSPEESIPSIGDEADESQEEDAITGDEDSQ
ncbi:hypothetical protein [Evansella clarkii]|uniref:hypothetical protein n=1 Tax=Evansella clarkii TaxID=79879 RepID=UPI003B845F78